jgi:hypothetical protein
MAKVLAEIFMLRLEAISRASPPSVLDSTDARFVPIRPMPIPVELGPDGTLSASPAER